MGDFQQWKYARVAARKIKEIYANDNAIISIWQYKQFGIAKIYWKFVELVLTAIGSLKKYIINELYTILEKEIERERDEVKKNNFLQFI